MNHDISIVGMSIKVPNADNIEQLWDIMKNKEVCTGKIPADRWNAEALTPDVNWMGSIKDYNDFDPSFFRISPREACHMEPQQKMILQEVWRCIEDSGIPLKELQRKKTAVYISYFLIDNKNNFLKRGDIPEKYDLAGNVECSLSNRISYCFDLTGESLTVNTACSGGLVCLYHAKRALAEKECDYAIVGGVNLNLDEWKYKCLDQGHMLSHDGRCKAFSINANGYVSSEGALVFLLQRKEDTERDHNDAYAVIKGAAVNYTGKSYSITAPKIESQRNVILGALEDAGMNADEISYIEAHGTGTSLGDPIEIEALTQAFRKYTDRKNYCNIGTVKCNIGHLEPAAGLAGLAKVVSMFRHRAIPPIVDNGEENPIIDFENSPFRTNYETVEWKQDGPLTAGISSFGFSGMNSHVIVQEYVSEKKADTLSAAVNNDFILSARTEKSLKKNVRKWKEALTKNGEDFDINDLCFNVQNSRSDFRYRIHIKAKDIYELINGLDSADIFHSENSVLDELEINMYFLPSYEDTDKLFARFESIRSSYSRYCDMISSETDISDGTEADLTRQFVLSYCIYEMLLDSGVNVKRLRAGKGSELLTAALAKAVSLSEAVKVYTGRINADNIDFFPLSMDITDGNKIFYHDIHVEKDRIPELINCFRNNFVHMSENDRRISDKLLSDVKKLYHTQNTIKKNIDLWNDVLTDHDISLTDFINGSYDVRNADEWFIINIVFADVYIEVLNRWKITDRLRFENADIRLMKSMIAAKCLNRSQLIEAIKGNISNAPEYIDIPVTDICREELSAFENYNERDIVSFIMQNKDERSSYAVSDDICSRIRNMIADYWKKGIDIDWEHINSGVTYRKYHLPVYQYDYYEPSLNEEAPAAKTAEIDTENVTVDAVSSIVRDIAAETVFMSSDDIDNNTNLNDYGFESLTIAEFIKRLNERLGISLTLLTYFMYPTVNKIAGYIFKEYGQALSIGGSNDLSETADNNAAGDSQLADCLIKAFSDITGIDEEYIELSNELSDYDLDAYKMSRIIEMINKHCGISATPLLFADCLTINDIMERVGELSSGVDNGTIDETVHVTQEVCASHSRKIAIVGMSLAVPGADEMDSFYGLLEKNRSVLGEVPLSRWDWDSFYGSLDDNSSYRKLKYKAGFIEDFEFFDNEFWNISYKEALVTDPQQRVLLGAVLKAVTDAGIRLEDLAGRKVGVFTAATTDDYYSLVSGNGLLSDPKRLTGNYHCFIANRISFMFDLHGPSENIDTACSSGIVACHRARQALLDMECDIAVVAGVNVIAIPETFLSLERSNMLSATDACHSFSSEADGYARSEGAGVLILKTYDDAVKDDDHIYASICGSAVSHSGRTGGITTPDIDSLSDVIYDAWKDSGEFIGENTFIELHGTGSVIGDSIEYTALESSIRHMEHDSGRTLAPGSVFVGTLKPVIGHLEAASGIVEIIKAVVQMNNDTLFAIGGLEELNPNISENDHSCIELLKAHRKWKKHTDERLRYGINSYGFGGLNAHIVLESCDGNLSLDTEVYPRNLYLYSAKSRDALIELVRRNAEFLQSDADVSGRIDDYAYTLQCCCQHYTYRAAFTASSREELIGKLIGYCNNEVGEREISCKTYSADDIESAISDRKIDILADIWLGNSGRIDWKRLYGGAERNRVRVPSYPFSKKRCWLELSYNQSGISDDITFTQTIGFNDSIVSDHLVGECRYVPAVNYLLNVAEKLKEAYPDKCFEMCSVRFIMPCIVMKDTVIEYSINLADKGGSFVAKAPDSDIVYAKGEIKRRVAPEMLHDSGSVSGDSISAEALYERIRQRGIYYGETYRKIKNAVVGSDRFEGSIVTSSCDTIAERAALFDSSLQGVFMYLDDMFVPFEAESVYLDPTVSAGSFRSNMYISQDHYDISFSDESRRTFLEVNGLVMRQAKKESCGILTPVWEKIHTDRENAESDPERTIAVMPVFSEKTFAVLKSYYHNIEYICTDDIINGSTEEFDGTVRRVIFVVPEGRNSLSYLAESYKTDKTAVSFFRLVKKMIENEMDGCDISVMIVTHSAFNVTGCDSIDPFGSDVIGMALSVRKEISNWQITCFDTDTFTEDTVRAMEAINRYSSGASALYAFRNGEVYIRKLEKTDVPDKSSIAPFNEESVVLIIGGGSGIGALTAAHIADRYHSRIAVCGRRAVLKDKPDYVDYYSCDISDPLQVERLFDGVLQKYGRIDTVIHSALVLDDSTIANMTEEQLLRGLAPKTSGVINVVSAMRTHNAGQLIVYSSVMSFANYAGQSNYSGGSVFIDSFAAYAANELGIRCKVFNWGLWSQTGIVTDSFHVGVMKKKGFLGMENAEGMEMLEAGLRCTYGQMVVLKQIGSGVTDELNDHRYPEAYADTEDGGFSDYLAERLITADKVNELLDYKSRIKHISVAFADRILKTVGNASAAITGRNAKLLYNELREAVEADGDMLDAITETGDDCYTRLLDKIEGTYTDVLYGRTAATELLFSKDTKQLVADIYGNNDMADYYNTIITRALQYKLLTYLRSVGKPDKKIRILEVGAGTGGTTRPVAEGLEPFSDFIEYYYTDISKSFVLHAEERFGRYDFFRFRTLNMDKPLEGDLAEMKFDYVICANVIHAVADLDLALDNLNRLVDISGSLILYEMTEKLLFNTIIFGLLDGWWLYENDRRRINGSPLLTKYSWKTVLEKHGFGNIFFYGDKSGSRNIGQNIIIAEKCGESAAPDISADEVQEQVIVDDRKEAFRTTDDVISGVIGMIEGVVQEKISDPRKTFVDCGIDSIMAIEIIEKINAAFGLRLRAVDIFKYVSPYGLAEHIKEIKKTDP